jgi:hypothetical protein
MLTKIDLCSRALLKIGEQPIAGFNEGSAASKIAAGLYELAVDALLCAHPWRFATKKIRLAKTSGGYFLLPTDVLRIIGCDADGYEIAGNKITAEPDEMEIIAVARAGAERFPSYFQTLAATKLAMEFCIPLTGNQNTYALLNALYENELRAAKTIDSAAIPAKSSGGSSLLSARF